MMVKKHAIQKRLNIESVRRSTRSGKIRGIETTKRDIRSGNIKNTTNRVTSSQYKNKQKVKPAPHSQVASQCKIKILRLNFQLINMITENTVEIFKRSSKLPVPYSNQLSWWNRLFRRKSIYEKPLPDYHPIQRLQRFLRQTQHFSQFEY